MQRRDAPALTVVIPSYNSARWLPSTIEALAETVQRADVAVEVIVVDDGSTDDTTDVIGRLAVDFPGDLAMLRQENKGRFLARWAGIERAKADLILLLDSRVVVSADALERLLPAVDAEPGIGGWNAHVLIDPRAPLVGSFWEVPTHIFWGRYLRRPRPYDLTPETFDTAPKGTGAFLAPKDRLVDAFQAAWPEGDARLISDDTKILRRIAERGGIRLLPSFVATYRPRTTLRAFVKHSFDRGTLFVDSYAGTSVPRSLIILLVAFTPLALVVLVAGLAFAGYTTSAAMVVLAVILFALCPLIPAAINRCPSRGLLSYLCYLPVFVAPFWAGLVRGVVIHRRAFFDRSRTIQAPGGAQS